MADFKPCPFCGSEEIAWELRCYCAKVLCPKCRASIKVEGKRYVTLAAARRKYEPMLEKAWNRRAEDGK